MDFDMQKNLTLPVLPLRGLVVFPKSLIHFDVGRKKSITAINKAMKADQLVFLTSQKDAAINEPDIFDVYDTGVIAKVVQVLKQPENTTRIVIEGQCRATIINPVFDEKCLVAEVKPYEEESEYLTARDSALMRTVKNEFDKYLEISPKMPSDIIFKVALCKRPGELADFITANLILDYRVKQSILETFPESERLESVLDVLVNENFVLKLEDEISQKAKMRIDENQRDYFLREQKRAIEATNTTQIKKLYTIKQKLENAKTHAEFDKLLQEISAVDAEIDHDNLTSEQKTHYDQLNKSCTDTISAKMRQLEYKDNIDYNKKAVNAYNSAFTSFKNNESRYKDKSQLLGLVSTTLFAYDAGRLFNETLIFYNHVYSYIFNKLDDNGKLELTKYSIECERKQG